MLSRLDALKSECGAISRHGRRAAPNVMGASTLGGDGRTVPKTRLEKVAAAICAEAGSEPLLSERETRLESLVRRHRSGPRLMSTPP